MNRRNELVDFWRGFVLVMIFVNHVPGNVLEDFTPRNFGFSDSAEAFIFLAGLSVALVYYPRIPAGDALGVLRRCARRAFELYRVHLLLTFAAVALSALAYVASEHAELIEAHGRGTVFHDTAQGVAGIVLLGHQLGYFNILPLYVVLMLWAPVVLVLARVHVLAALAVAVLLYAGARLWGLALPSWPEPGVWYFNPFAWQLLFTIGVVCGVLFADERPAVSDRIAKLSWAVVAVGALVVTEGFGLAAGLRDWVFARLDLAKGDLGLVRLLHFLALAYLVASLRLGSSFAATRPGAELRRLGRNGLAVFAVGSLLSALGQTVVALAAVKASPSPQLLGMLFTLLGIAALAALGHYLEWNRSDARASGAGSSSQRSSPRSPRSRPIPIAGSPSASSPSRTAFSG
jgi:hypothetical protein